MILGAEWAVQKTCTNSWVRVRWGSQWLTQDSLYSYLNPVSTLKVQEREGGNIFAKIEATGRLMNTSQYQEQLSRRESSDRGDKTA